MNLTPYPGDTRNSLGNLRPREVPSPHDTGVITQKRIIMPSSSVVLRRLRKRRGECLSCGLKLLKPSEDDAAKASDAPGLNIQTRPTNTNGLCQACTSGSPTSPAVTAAGQSTKQQDNEKEILLGNHLKPHRELSVRTKATSTRSGLSKSRSQRQSTRATGRSTASGAATTSGTELIRMYQSPLGDYAVASKYELEEMRSEDKSKTAATTTNMMQQQLPPPPPPARPGRVGENEAAESPIEMGVLSSHDGGDRNFVPPKRHSSTSDVEASDISTLGQESVMSKGVTLKRIRERQGFCSECGNQTHTFVEDMITGENIKQPCSVEGLVHRGRCLRCHPLPAHVKQPAPPPHYLPPPPPAPIADIDPSSPEGPTDAPDPSPKTQARTEPMAPPASVLPTDKPKSILRRSSSYNSSVSVGSATSDKSKKSVTISIQGDDSSIASEGENCTEMGISFRSMGNTSRRKSARTLGYEDDSSYDDIPSFGHSKEYKKRRAKRAARKEEKAAIARLKAIGNGSNGRGGGDLIDIVATMRQYATSDEVQLLGATELYERSKSKSEGKLIGRSGAIATILDSMKYHRKSADLHLACCKLIRNLASCTDHNCKVLVKYCAFSLLCDTMEGHQEEIGIQSRGCAALASLSNESTRTDDTLFDKVRVLGCIVGAVSAFPEQEETLRAAYSALKAYGYKPMKVLSAWQDPSARCKLISSSG